MRAIRRLAVNEPIEGGLPADNAVNEFLAEATIGRGEFRAMQGGFEQIFDEFARFPALQNLHRNFSWFLAGHDL